MPKYPIGELVQARVREYGVTPFYKFFEHDGVRGPNIATVYSDRGAGVRPPVVFYNRSNEAGASSSRVILIGKGSSRRACGGFIPAASLLRCRTRRLN